MDVPLYQPGGQKINCRAMPNSGTTRTILRVEENYELGQSYIKSMAVPATTSNVATKEKKRGQKGNPAQRAKTFFEDGKCFRCGSQYGDNFEGHKEQCKAKEHTCKKCGKLGHFPSVCLSSHPAANKMGMTKTNNRANNAAPAAPQPTQPTQGPSDVVVESSNMVRT